VTDRTKAVEPQFRVHGVPARVTVPDGDPVETRIIDWGRGATFPTGGGDMPVSELRHEMSLRRDHVPATPTRTMIELLDPATGAVTGTFQVDAIGAEDLDVVRAVVVPLVIV